MFVNESFIVKENIQKPKISMVIINCNVWLLIEKKINQSNSCTNNGNYKYVIIIETRVLLIVNQVVLYK